MLVTGVGAFTGPHLFENTFWDRDQSGSRAHTGLRTHTGPSGSIF